MARARSGRRWWLAPLVVVLGLVGTGCDTGIDGIDDGGSGPATKPVTLIVSETWVNDHQGDPGAGGAAGGSDVQARLTTLQKAIDRLRDETGTGWVGRQDDVTGYLSELSGGSWPGTPTAFMDDNGPDLFGVDSAVLRLGEPDTVTVPGIVTTKATQAVGDVPVLDASLVFVERDGRLTGVRGRVFPGLSVLTDPEAPGRPGARDRRAGGGRHRAGHAVAGGDAPRRRRARLAGPGGHDRRRHHPDRRRELLHRRHHRRHPQRPAGHRRGPGRAPVGGLGGDVPAPGPSRLGDQRGRADPNSVEITGPNPIGGTLTGHGVQTDKGVALVDTTTPVVEPGQRERRHLHLRRHEGEEQLAAARQARGQPRHQDPRRRGDGRAGAEPRRLRLLRGAGPRLVGRPGRLDGLDGPLRPFGLLQLLLHQLAAPAADGLRQPVHHLAGPGRGHRGRDRHRRPRDHPRCHRDLGGAEVHRPVRRPQRELLRLLRQRDRQPGQGHRQRRDLRGWLHRLHRGDHLLHQRTPTAACRCATCSPATTSTTTCARSTRATGSSCSASAARTRAACTTTPRSGTTRSGRSGSTWPRSTVRPATSRRWHRPSTRSSTPR